MITEVVYKEAITKLKHILRCPYSVCYFPKAGKQLTSPNHRIYLYDSSRPSTIYTTTSNWIHKRVRITFFRTLKPFNIRKMAWRGNIRPK